MESLFEILSTCKGGGYRYCRTNPPHPRRNAKGLYPLHRVLMENKIGRILLPGEVVHHQDEDKENNSPDNLQLLSNSDHSRLHRPKLDKVRCVCVCGSEFYVKPHEFRRRMSMTTSDKLFCSRKCVLNANRPSAS